MATPVDLTRPDDLDDPPPKPLEIGTREGYLNALQGFANAAFMAGRHADAARYMAIIGRAQGYLQPSAEDEAPAVTPADAAGHRAKVLELARRLGIKPEELG